MFAVFSASLFQAQPTQEIVTMMQIKTTLRYIVVDQTLCFLDHSVQYTLYPCGMPSYTLYIYIYLLVFGFAAVAFENSKFISVRMN